MGYHGLIAGLGNPGRRYAEHRHNFGFAVVQALLEQGDKLGQVQRIKEKGSFILHGWRPCQDSAWLVVRPLSYMNRSGEPIAYLARYYDIPLDRMLIVHDELDLDFGKLRFKFDSGLAGHNGLRSIAHHLGSKAFHRLRMGIGQPEGSRQKTADYVLSPFQPEEKRILPHILDEAATGISLFCCRGPEQAMNRVHALDRESFSENRV